LCVCALYSLVVSTGVVDRLARLVPRMTCYVLNWLVNSSYTHSSLTVFIQPS